MKSFLKYTLATIVGVIIASFIGGLIFFGVVGSIVSSSKDKTVKIKPNTILHLKLNKKIVDRASNNPMENFNFQAFEAKNNLGLNDILENIKTAKTDDNIKGIYLDLTVIRTGIASIEEIRNALLDFKQSNKFIVSYADYYTQSSYYLATVADTIYLNPEGIIELKGLHAELMFFKGALKKLDVEPQIIRHGKFKSAVEPFMLDKMSEANREQYNAFMGSIWDKFLKGISEQRNISIKDLTNYVDNLAIRNPKSALKHKIIDGIKYKDEIISELKDRVKIEQNKKLRLISISKYKNVPKKPKYKHLVKNKIAVIYASGEINMGKGSDKTIGAEKLSSTIRKARLDTTIKAVVLRVNSPGGSALASEVIWREVFLTKKVKPVIASMGDVAASGGYYISCAADTIVASPNTITGSIGVFGLLWNGEKFLKNKLGITVDRVKTNKYADLGSVTRRMTASERDIIQTSVEDIYDTFISHVADGRNMTKEAVDEIGQGRVWSGENAKEIGLVDVFGGLNKAVEIAAEKANLEKYRIVSLPKQVDPFTQIMKQLQGDVATSIIRNKLGSEYKYYERIQQLTKINGCQARIPFDIDIH
ncbi:MAG: signal peptide peptidase SppA [Bacteroidales bacterium]|nr:signal peptide peptidase SppA [Bacteroidales bacterium]